MHVFNHQNHGQTQNKTIQVDQMTYFSCQNNSRGVSLEVRVEDTSRDDFSQTIEQIINQDMGKMRVMQIIHKPRHNKCPS